MKTLMKNTKRNLIYSLIFISIFASASESGTFYEGYCTAGVDEIKEGVSWRGHAKDWYKNAKNAGISVGSEPVLGSIVVFPGCKANGNYGHVGVIVKLDDDLGPIMISENDTGGLNNWTERRVESYPNRNNTTEPIGYIYYKLNKVAYRLVLKPHWNWNSIPMKINSYLNMKEFLNSPISFTQLSGSKWDSISCYNFTAGHSYACYSCKDNTFEVYFATQVDKQPKTIELKRGWNAVSVQGNKSVDSKCFSCLQNTCESIIDIRIDDSGYNDVSSNQYCSENDNYNPTKYIEPDTPIAIYVSEDYSWNQDDCSQ